MGENGFITIWAFGVFLPRIQLSNQTPVLSLELDFASNSVFWLFFPFNSDWRNTHQCQLKLIMQQRKYIKISNKMYVFFYPPDGICLTFYFKYSTISMTGAKIRFFLFLFLLMYKFQIYFSIYPVSTNENACAVTTLWKNEMISTLKIYTVHLQAVLKP